MLQSLGCDTPKCEDYGASPLAAGQLVAIRVRSVPKPSRTRVNNLHCMIGLDPPLMPRLHHPFCIQSSTWRRSEHSLHHIPQVKALGLELRWWMLPTEQDPKTLPFHIKSLVYNRSLRLKIAVLSFSNHELNRVLQI